MLYKSHGPSAGLLPNVRDCVMTMRKEIRQAPSLYKLIVVTIVLADADHMLAEGLDPVAGSVDTVMLHTGTLNPHAEPMHGY